MAGFGIRNLKTVIKIQGSQIWQPTGLIVNRRSATVNALDSGKFKWRFTEKGPEYGAAGEGTSAGQDYLLPQYNCGCLIGQIGSGKPFFIGDEGMVPITGLGELFLSMNRKPNLPCWGELEVVLFFTEDDTTWLPGARAGFTPERIGLNGELVLARFGAAGADGVPCDGIEISSSGTEKPFKSGVHGTVKIPAASEYNSIFVIPANRPNALVEYQYCSKRLVIDGQKVEPATDIGMTGSTAPSATPAAGGPPRVRIRVMDAESIGDQVNPRRWNPSLVNPEKWVCTPWIVRPESLKYQVWLANLGPQGELADGLAAGSLGADLSLTGVKIWVDPPLKHSRLEYRIRPLGKKRWSQWVPAGTEAHSAQNQPIAALNVRIVNELNVDRYCLLGRGFYRKGQTRSFTKLWDSRKRKNAPRESILLGSDSDDSQDPFVLEGFQLWIYRLPDKYSFRALTDNETTSISRDWLSEDWTAEKRGTFLALTGACVSSLGKFGVEIVNCIPRPRACLSFRKAGDVLAEGSTAYLSCREAWNLAFREQIAPLPVDNLRELLLDKRGPMSDPQGIWLIQKRSDDPDFLGNLC